MIQPTLTKCNKHNIITPHIVNQLILISVMRNRYYNIKFIACHRTGCIYTGNHIEPYWPVRSSTVLFILLNVYQIKRCFRQKLQILMRHFVSCTCFCVLSFLWESWQILFQSCCPLY